MRRGHVVPSIDHEAFACKSALPRHSGTRVPCYGRCDVRPVVGAGWRSYWRRGEADIRFYCLELCACPL